MLFRQRIQEQIAEKERQKKEEAEMRRQRDRQAEIPIASQMPAAGGHQMPPTPTQHESPHQMHMQMAPQVAPAPVPQYEGQRLGHQEDPAAEQRRKKQEAGAHSNQAGYSGCGCTF